MSEIKKNFAAIYVRVSTEEQAQEGLSIQAQTNVLTQYCQLYDLSVHKIYMDLGISGKDTLNRPGLQTLILDAQSGLFTVVLVWKISRLSRNLKDLLNLLALFEKNNIVFTSYSEKFDTATPVGKMTLQLLGSIAEFERNTIVENVKLGLTEYARKGGKTGAVLGYDNINKALIRNPNEADIILLIFRLYSQENLSLTAIADKLNQKGYRTKRGNLFGSNSVGTILDNPVYIGLNRHHIKKNDAFCVQAPHQPIISEDLWLKTQKLRMTQKSSGNKNYHPALLSGILTCPYCKKNMAIFYSYSRGNRYRYYKCHCKNTPHKTPLLINADKIEALLLNKILGLLADKNIIKDIIALYEFSIKQAYKAFHLTNSKAACKDRDYVHMLDHFFNRLSQNEMRSLFKSVFHNISVDKKCTVETISYRFPFPS